MEVGGAGAQASMRRERGEVETRDTTMWRGANVSARSTSSHCFGSTPMNTTSLPSTTSWLLAATDTTRGCACASAAALAAFRGDSRMAAGGAGRVQSPRTMALHMVPMPMKP